MTVEADGGGGGVAGAKEKKHNWKKLLLKGKTIESKINELFIWKCFSQRFFSTLFPRPMVALYIV